MREDFWQGLLRQEPCFLVGSDVNKWGKVAQLGRLRTSMAGSRGLYGTLNQQRLPITQSCYERSP